MLTLVKDSGNNSPKAPFYNKPHGKLNSQQDDEQFSMRLSTALRRNRNLDSASSVLFTKVGRKPLNQNENNNGFPGLEVFASSAASTIEATTSIFTSSKSTWLQKSTEEEEPALQAKDSWSLDDCLSEISAISYDRFANDAKISATTPETVSSLGAGLKQATSNVLLPFLQTKIESPRPEFASDSEQPTPRNLSPAPIGITQRLQTAMSICSSEDELQHLFDENESVGSSASSISWAPDAVEANLTLQLARLWEDIELVCSGQITEKPKGMSHSVYEECLLWKRAFPENSQKPSRFSTMTLIPEEEENADTDSTPTPTNDTRMFEFDSPPVSARCRPNSVRKHPDTDDYYDFESRADNCATPVPATSTEYVSAWLTHHHTHTHIHGHRKSVDEMSLLHETIPEEMQTNATGSPVLPTTEFRTMIQSSIITAARPLSSSSFGHLITPIPTGNYHVQRSQNAPPSQKTDLPVPDIMDARDTVQSPLKFRNAEFSVQAGLVLGRKQVDVPMNSPTATMQKSFHLQNGSGGGSFRNNVKRSAFPDATTQRSSIRRPNRNGSGDELTSQETPFMQWLLDSGR